MWRSTSVFIRRIDIHGIPHYAIPDIKGQLIRSGIGSFTRPQAKSDSGSIPVYAGAFGICDDEQAGSDHPQVPPITLVPLIVIG